jgi:hypothetical protein
MYLVCPELLCAVGETSFGIQVGFIGLDEVLTFLFIYLFVSEMGGACGAYGRGERCAHGCGGET